jgi:hypothetical protein
MGFGSSEGRAGRSEPANYPMETPSDARWLGRVGALDGDPASDSGEGAKHAVSGGAYWETESRAGEGIA